MKQDNPEDRYVPSVRYEDYWLSATIWFVVFFVCTIVLIAGVGQ